MFDPEPRFRALESKHILDTSRSLFPCCSPFRAREVKKKSPIIGPDRESGPVFFLRREIVRKSSMKRQVSPCRLSQDCALNQLTRLESLPDSRCSRKGVLYSGFAPLEWWELKFCERDSPIISPDLGSGTHTSTLPKFVRNCRHLSVIIGSRIAP